MMVLSEAFSRNLGFAAYLVAEPLACARYAGIFALSTIGRNVATIVAEWASLQLGVRIAIP